MPQSWWLNLRVNQPVRRAAKLDSCTGLDASKSDLGSPTNLNPSLLSALSNFVESATAFGAPGPASGDSLEENRYVGGSEIAKPARRWRRRSRDDCLAASIKAVSRSSQALGVVLAMWSASMAA